jgi:hypothetical protein
MVLWSELDIHTIVMDEWNVVKKDGSYTKSVIVAEVYYVLPNMVAALECLDVIHS